MTHIQISGAGIEAAISPYGAELQSLRLGGHDVLWSGDPAWWGGRAPILFPILGVPPGEGYRLNGETLGLPKHGFARRKTFAVAAQSADAVTLRLEDDAETRGLWPFAFRLDLRFAAIDGGLETTALVTNTGDGDMPFSFGFHPAFRWPLDGSRAAHQVRFARAEAAPIRRVGADGLVLEARYPSPVEEDTLPLRDALFEDDALILPDVASDHVVYGVPGRAGLRLDWHGLPDLAIWMKPGADYLCIEPWAGTPAPAGFAGDLWEKPGILRLAPGATRTFGMTVTATTA